MAPSSRLHLMTSMSVSGGSQIGEISASSSTHPLQFLSHSLWTAGISSGVSGGLDDNISEWAVPKDAHSNASPDSRNATRASFMQILAITTAHDACIIGDLPTAEVLLNLDIHTNANNYTSYAHCSFVMARKHAWDLALEDAIKASYIDSSYLPYKKADFHSRHSPSAFGPH
jgi:hypothetical protein